jgi:general stress protein 26
MTIAKVCPTQFVLLLILTAAADAQVATPSRSDIVSASRDVMQKARYCSLITIGADGHPQARIVDPLGPDASFTIWIATNPLTRKVAEIKRDPRVTLTCFDASSSSYVTVLARATLVTDAAEKARRWKDEWTPFYSSGASGNDVMLFRLVPRRLEIVSVDRGMAGDPKTWRPLSIDFP